MPLQVLNVINDSLLQADGSSVLSHWSMSHGQTSLTLTNHLDSALMSGATCIFTIYVK